MAGFWHLSHHQLRDPDGAVYAGARATFTEAATTTVLTVYQDYGLGTPHPSPVVANAYGVFPPVFFDETDGFYRQRITTKDGLLIPGTDVGTLPIIGPGDGGGGSEVPVDPNALFKTGYPLWLPTSGSLAGFVRMNGRTIGSATSGASERANSDTELLYSFLYDFSDSICPVAGGRGASVGADWAANKAIGLIDMRGRGPFGLADMGNSDSTRLADGTFITGDATTAASTGGASGDTLTIAQMPAHDHGGVTGNPTTHPSLSASPIPLGGVNVGTSIYAPNTQTSPTLPDHVHSIASQGGGTAHNTMPPFMLGTWYIRL